MRYCGYFLMLVSVNPKFYFRGGILVTFLYNVSMKELQLVPGSESKRFFNTALLCLQQLRLAGLLHRMLNYSPIFPLF